MSSIVQNIRDRQSTPLYDTYQLAGSTALPVTINFFNSRTRSANGAEITNMSKAGELEHPERFAVKGMSFVPIGTPSADLLLLMKGYSCALIIGSKSYLEAPMEYFGNIGGVAGFAATTATTTTISHFQNGTPNAANFQMLDEPLVISAGETFRVAMMATSSPGSTSGALFLRCYLIGQWEKPVR